LKNFINRIGETEMIKTLTKISKAKFMEISKKGIYLIKAIWNFKDDNEVLKIINSIDDIDYYKTDSNYREMINDSQYIKFKRKFGMDSYLDISNSGKLNISCNVFQHNNIFVVKKELGNGANNLIIYCI
jgi:hypothetical protein